MYLMTHSLLSSWLWLLRDEWSEDPMADFLAVLRREPTPTTDAMQAGIDLEDMVTHILGGDEVSGKWADAAHRIADICKGGVLQYKASKEIEVDGVPLLLYGRMDCLKAGEIIDIKYSKGYERGKYQDSTQHPVYLELIPEAERFIYTVSNGVEVWTESYRRDEVRDIRPVISDFLAWLDRMGLMDIYRDKWRAL